MSVHNVFSFVGNTDQHVPARNGRRARYEEGRPQVNAGNDGGFSSFLFFLSLHSPSFGSTLLCNSFANSLAGCPGKSGVWSYHCLHATAHQYLSGLRTM